MEAVYLTAMGFSRSDAAKATGCTETTVRSSVTAYQEGGIQALQTFRVGGSTSDWDTHTASLHEEFEQRPPRSGREAGQRIQALTGLQRVRAYLHRAGLQYRRVAPIPSKANPEVQETFLTEPREPILAEAQAGLRHVFFMDAAHFVRGAFLGYLWCLTRIFVPTSPGRQRFNVLGALHAITHEVITFTNTGYINSTSVATLLGMIHAKFHNLPLTIVLDNAAYQRNTFVREKAATLGMTLLFLPPYSPNLNLIERLWKSRYLADPPVSTVQVRRLKR